MNIERLDNVLESLLFMSGDGIKVDTVCDSLELQKSEVKKSIKRLSEKYDENSGIKIIEYNGKIQFCTNPAYDEEISKVLNPLKEKALSNATLETITIVAYKQPVTKLEVENIRGVNCDYTIQVLQRLKLIEVVGRKDSVGHPQLYGTTDEFLKRFSISKIDELPNYKGIIEDIENINSEEVKSESLYDNYDVPSEDTPAFLEGEQVALIEADEVSTDNK